MQDGSQQLSKVQGSLAHPHRCHLVRPEIRLSKLGSSFGQSLQFLYKRTFCVSILQLHTTHTTRRNREGEGEGRTFKGKLPPFNLKKKSNTFVLFEAYQIRHRPTRPIQTRLSVLFSSHDRSAFSPRTCFIVLNRIKTIRINAFFIYEPFHASASRIDQTRSYRLQRLIKRTCCVQVPSRPPCSLPLPSPPSFPRFFREPCNRKNKEFFILN